MLKIYFFDGWACCHRRGKEIILPKNNIPSKTRKKNCRVVLHNVHFTGFTSRENCLSNTKLKLFEESKTIVGYFKTQIFLGAKLQILSKFNHEHGSFMMS